MLWLLLFYAAVLDLGAKNASIIKYLHTEAGHCFGVIITQVVILQLKCRLFGVSSELYSVASRARLHSPTARSPNVFEEAFPSTSISSPSKSRATTGDGALPRSLRLL